MGRPVHAKVRRLSPEKLEAAKQEFQIMLDLNIIRPSSSSWASALRMQPKKSGGFRACGDYRALNNITVPDRYPVPNIQDFSANLAGCTIFSKIILIYPNQYFQPKPIIDINLTIFPEELIIGKIV